MKVFILGMSMINVGLQAGLYGHEGHLGNLLAAIAWVIAGSGWAYVFTHNYSPNRH